MIINKGQSNDIAVTVTELTTIASPTYLFEFIPKDGTEKKYCISANTNTDRRRFDNFIITEQASPNNLIGQVELEIGSYRYNIYAQVSTTNLNPALADELTENGILDVYGDNNPVTEYNGQDLNNTSYHG